MKLVDKKFAGRRWVISESRRLSGDERRELVNQIRDGDVVERIAQMIGQLPENTVRSMIEDLLSQGKSRDEIIREIGSTGLAGDTQLGESASKIMDIISQHGPDAPAGTSGGNRLKRGPAVGEEIDGVGMKAGSARHAQQLPPGASDDMLADADMPENVELGPDSKPSDIPLDTQEQADTSPDEESLPQLLDKAVDSASEAASTVNKIKTKLDSGAAVDGDRELEPVQDAGFLPDGQENKVAFSRKIAANPPSNEDMNKALLLVEKYKSDNLTIDDAIDAINESKKTGRPVEDVVKELISVLAPRKQQPAVKPSSEPLTIDNILNKLNRPKVEYKSPKDLADEQRPDKYEKYLEEVREGEEVVVILQDLQEGTRIAVPFDNYVSNPSTYPSEDYKFIGTQKIDPRYVVQPTGKERMTRLTRTVIDVNGIPVPVDLRALDPMMPQYYEKKQQYPGVDTSDVIIPDAINEYKKLKELYHEFLLVDPGNPALALQVAKQIAKENSPIAAADRIKYIKDLVGKGVDLRDAMNAADAIDESKRKRIDQLKVKKLMNQYPGTNLDIVSREDGQLEVVGNLEGLTYEMWEQLENAGIAVRDDVSGTFKPIFSTSDPKPSDLGSAKWSVLPDKLQDLKRIIKSADFGRMWHDTASKLKDSYHNELQSIEKKLKNYGKSLTEEDKKLILEKAKELAKQPGAPDELKSLLTMRQPTPDEVVNEATSMIFGPNGRYEDLVAVLGESNLPEALVRLKKGPAIKTTGVSEDKPLAHHELLNVLKSYARSISAPADLRRIVYPNYSPDALLSAIKSAVSSGEANEKLKQLAKKDKLSERDIRLVNLLRMADELPAQVAKVMEPAEGASVDQKLTKLVLSALHPGTSDIDPSPEFVDLLKKLPPTYSEVHSAIQQLNNDLNILADTDSSSESGQIVKDLSGAVSSLVDNREPTLYDIPENVRNTLVEEVLDTKPPPVLRTGPVFKNIPKSGLGIEYLKDLYSQLMSEIYAKEAAAGVLEFNPQKFSTYDDFLEKRKQIRLNTTIPANVYDKSDPRKTIRKETAAVPFSILDFPKWFYDMLGLSEGKLLTFDLSHGGQIAAGAVGPQAAPTKGRPVSQYGTVSTSLPGDVPYSSMLGVADRPATTDMLSEIVDSLDDTISAVKPKLVSKPGEPARYEPSQIMTEMLNAVGNSYRQQVTNEAAKAGANPKSYVHSIAGASLNDIRAGNIKTPGQLHSHIMNAFKRFIDKVDPLYNDAGGPATDADREKEISKLENKLQTAASRGLSRYKRDLVDWVSNALSASAGEPIDESAKSQLANLDAASLTNMASDVSNRLKKTVQDERTSDTIDLAKRRRRVLRNSDISPVADFLGVITSEDFENRKKVIDNAVKFQEQKNVDLDNAVAVETYRAMLRDKDTAKSLQETAKLFKAINSLPDEVRGKPEAIKRLRQSGLNPDLLVDYMPQSETTGRIRTDDMPARRFIEKYIRPSDADLAAMTEKGKLPPELTPAYVINKMKNTDLFKTVSKMAADRRKKVETVNSLLNRSVPQSLIKFINNPDIVQDPLIRAAVARKGQWTQNSKMMDFVEPLLLAKMQAISNEDGQLKRVGANALDDDELKSVYDVLVALWKSGGGGRIKDESTSYSDAIGVRPSLVDRAKGELDEDTDMTKKSSLLNIINLVDAVSEFESKTGSTIPKATISKIADTLSENLNTDDVDTAKAFALLSHNKYASLAMLAVVDYVNSLGDKANSILDTVKHGIVKLAVSDIPELAKVAAGMKVPSLGKSGDSVKLDHSKDKANSDDEMLARPAHIKFSIDNQKKTGSYMIVDVSWDPDCDACRGVGRSAMEQLIKSFMKGVESNKNFIDVGFAGKYTVTDLDMEAGTATVTFATDKGGLAPSLYTEE